MRQSRMNRILQAAFNGMEIVDAKRPLMLFPTQEDFDKATPGDPEDCGFTHTVQRVCGSTQAHFFKTCLYIDHPDENGVIKAHRYLPAKGVLEAITRYDRRQPVNVKKAFVCMPPYQSRSIVGIRQANKRYRRSDVYKTSLRALRADTEVRAAEREVEQTKEQVRKIANTAMPRQIAAARKQVQAATTRLTRAKEVAHQLAKKLDTLRTDTHNTGKARVLKLDLTVRSGTGAFIHKLAERKKRKAA